MAVVTVQTLSQQLGKTVFSKIELLLSGLDFFMVSVNFAQRQKPKTKNRILSLVWTELATFQSQLCSRPLHCQ